MKWKRCWLLPSIFKSVQLVKPWSLWHAPGVGPMQKDLVFCLFVPLLLLSWYCLILSNLLALFKSSALSQWKASLVFHFTVFPGCNCYISHCHLENCWNQKHRLGMDRSHLVVQYCNLCFPGSFEVCGSICIKWKGLESGGEPTSKYHDWTSW